MHKLNFRPLVLAVAGLALVASACGGSNGTPATTRGTVVVAGFNFNESTILAGIYGKALEAKGYTVTYKTKLGNRQIVEPALASGQIDFYPGYAASELEFINRSKGEATGDAQATTDKLNTYLSQLPNGGAKALKPSTAFDGNAFAVLRATADKYHLTKLSDLTPIAGQLTLGGPPECPTNAFCAPGLERVYGITFKSVLALDADGPITRAALTGGRVDVAEVFSSDGDLGVRGYVVLEDDKHMIAADNVVPVIRNKVLNAEITTLFDSISAALNTPDLQAMNKSADVDKEDPDVLAAKWLKKHGFVK